MVHVDALFSGHIPSYYAVRDNVPILIIVGDKTHLFYTEERKQYLGRSTVYIDMRNDFSLTVTDNSLCKPDADSAALVIKIHSKMINTQTSVVVSMITIGSSLTIEVSKLQEYLSSKEALYEGNYKLQHETLSSTPLLTVIPITESSSRIGTYISDEVTAFMMYDNKIVFRDKSTDSIINYITFDYYDPMKYEYEMMARKIKNVDMYVLLIKEYIQDTNDLSNAYLYSITPSNFKSHGSILQYIDGKVLDILLVTVDDAITYLVLEEGKITVHPVGPNASSTNIDVSPLVTKLCIQGDTIYPYYGGSKEQYRVNKPIGPVSDKFHRYVSRYFMDQRILVNMPQDFTKGIGYLLVNINDNLDPLAALYRNAMSTNLGAVK